MQVLACGRGTGGGDVFFPFLWPFISFLVLLSTLPSLPRGHTWTMRGHWVVNRSVTWRPVYPRILPHTRSLPERDKFWNYFVRRSFERRLFRSTSIVGIHLGMRHWLHTALALFFLTVAKIMNEEQRITVCKASLNQIYTMIRTSPHNWRNYINLARSVISHLDATTFMQQPSRTSEQVWMAAGLQHLAYMDADNGAVNDVASWCSRQWLTISQREPQNIAALRGIGQSWLSHAQPVLARIHRAENSSSSSGGSSQRSGPSRSTGDEERRSSTERAEMERRVDTQNYVEARQYLQPATEYLERAVAAATTQGAVSGDLLATAAEAYMSLGNTSSPRVNERYFRRALQLLRAAAAVPGYTLSHYLQQYLNDYGRLLD